LVFGYYDFGKRGLFALSKNFAGGTALARKYPIHHLNNTVELLVVGVSHVVLCAALTGLSGYGVKDLGLTGGPELVWLIALGVPLGVGEMVLSALVCRVILEVLLVLAPANTPTGLQGWLTVSRGGWLRHYMRTVAILPLPIALALTCVNVAAEEFVFRALMLNYFESYGAIAAVALSTFFFALMQTFLMPSWRNAFFPVVGALVMGGIHGTLFMLVPSLVPLIVAHVVFFTFAIL
jgi:hypothetical protein